MATKDLSGIDLAQLRILRLVHRIGSFSAAAEDLGIAQSSVSYAIGRLREAFDDPLFVRQGARVVATDRCHEIVEDVSKMLDRLQDLAERRAFDPAVTEAEITVSCNAYERLILMPPLVRQVRRVAPGLRVNIKTAFTDGHRHLLDGSADLVVGPVEVRESGIYSEPLMPEHYVCVLDPANPLADHLTEEVYLNAGHLVVTYGGAWRSPYQRALEARGHELKRIVGTPSLADLPSLLAGTDLVATVPSRIGHSFNDRGRVVDCPFSVPFDIHLQWAARSNASPLNTWLRDVLTTIAAEICARPPGQV